MPVTAGIAIGAPLVSGLLGNLFSGDDKRKQEDAMRQALANYSNINAPSPEEMKLLLSQYQGQGELTPESLGTVNMADTQLQNIVQDQSLKDAQRKALQSLVDQGQNGFSDVDKAAMGQVRRQVAGDEKSNQAAILQNMQQRGIGGSGNELAAKLASSQGSANTEAMQAEQLLAQAQKNRLEALSQSGALAGDIGKTEFGQQAEIMSAQDRINQMRAANSQNVMGQNVSARNAAQQANLQQKQNIANMNTAESNRAQQYNKELLQQQFANKMGLANAKSGQELNQAAFYGQRAGDTQGMMGKLGAGAATAGAGIYTSNNKARTEAATPDAGSVAPAAAASNPYSNTSYAEDVLSGKTSTGKDDDLKKLGII